MKHIILILLIIPTLILSNENQNPSVGSTLENMNSYEVFTFISYDGIDKNKINEFIKASLKKVGSITTFESDSMIDGLVQSAPIGPMMFFSIKKNEVSLNVIAEVEVTANKKKTASSIWEKKIYVPTTDENEQADYSAITKSTEKLIKTFSEESAKVNHGESKKPCFLIRTHKSI